MIELTFHYSDYWTNAATQCLPRAWAGIGSFADLRTAVAGFTQTFMQQMAAQGTTPEYVSLGNESNGGLLYPFGCAYAQPASSVCPGSGCASASWPQLGQLYGAAYAAVKAVSPSTQVIIHLAYANGATPANAAASFNGYFASVTSNGGNYDVKGLSYYPFWSMHTIAMFADTATRIVAGASRPLLIMETGYDWNPTVQNGGTGQLASNAPETYPATPEGQKQFLLDLFATIKSAGTGKIIGDLYWDPVNILRNGQVSNTTLFDFTGNALPTLDVYQFNN